MQTSSDNRLCPHFVCKLKKQQLKDPPNENSVRVIAKHIQDELFADSKPFPSDYSFFFFKSNEECLNILAILL